MAAGIPGIGIGGIFYLICGLLLPVVELIQTFRGRSSAARWRFVGLQFSFSGGIVFGFYLTGKLIGWILTATSHQGAAHSWVNAGGTVLRIQPFFISLGTLALLLTAVQIINAVLDSRKTPRLKASLE